MIMRLLDHCVSSFLKLYLIKRCLLRSVIKKLLEMSNKIRGKISSLIGKEFDSELFYGVSDNK